MKSYFNDVDGILLEYDPWKAAKECARICALELFFYNTSEEKRQWWIDVINEIETL